MIDEALTISRTRTVPMPLESGDRVVLERRIAQLEQRVAVVAAIGASALIVAVLSAVLR